MQFDLTPEDWPPPSPDDVLRARVLNRARSITMRRFAPVVLSLTVVSAFVAVDRMPGRDSSARVDMLDGGGSTEPTADAAVGQAAPVIGAPDAAAASPDGAGTPVGRVSGGRQTKAASAAGAASTPTVAAVYGADTLVLADRTGDGRHAEVACVGFQCAGNPRSQPNQPALDVVEALVADDGAHVRATVKVLDIDVAPDETVQVNGVPASHVSYAFTFDVDGGTVRMWVTRAIADGAVTSTAHYHEGSSMASTAKIHGTTGSVDIAANTAAVTVPLSALNAARSGHPPLADGSTLRAFEGGSYAATRDVDGDSAAAFAYDGFETKVASDHTL